jgi:hypothetical protein
MRMGGGKSVHSCIDLQIEVRSRQFRALPSEKEHPVFHGSEDWAVWRGKYQHVCRTWIQLIEFLGSRFIG